MPRIIGISDGRGTGEKIADLIVGRAFQSETSEPILGNFEAGAGVPHLRSEIADIGNVKPGIVGYDDDRCVLERSTERRDQFFFFRSVHGSSPVKSGSQLNPCCTLTLIRAHPKMRFNQSRLALSSTTVQANSLKKQSKELASTLSMQVGNPIKHLNKQVYLRSRTGQNGPETCRSRPYSTGRIYVSAEFFKT